MSGEASQPGDRGAGGAGDSSAQARRRLIEERQKRSIFWKVVHILGSMRLALFLLATIALACAVATFYESSFNAKIAQHYIYKAPWFIFWLALLCVNLFAVTLTRWPWQKKHVGFIITHYGIIVLLFGAVIGSRLGFEGNVTLRTDQPPTDRITTSRSIVQIEDPNSPAHYYIRPFDASVTRPSPARPRTLEVPGTAWRIVAADFAEHLVKEPAIAEVEGGKPAAVFVFEGAAAGGRFRLALAAGDPPASLSGMAAIYLAEALPEPVERKSEETQMVFAKFQPVVQGEPSGAVVLLDPAASTARVLTPSGASLAYPLAEVLDKEIQIEDMRLSFLGYWPDFEMRDGAPSSKSGRPENPALLVRITRERTAFPEGALPPQAAKGPAMIAAVAPGGGAVEFAFLRDGKLVSRGEMRPGEAVATGWNDWTARLVEASSSAVVRETVRPAEEGKPWEATGIPGFLARLEVPGEGGARVSGEPVWVESGSITTLVAGSEKLQIGYGLQLERVPFTIRLVDFQVPRFEGTQNPSNFIATVEFRDRSTGETKTGTAKMNSPANWPGGLLPLLTGDNYKFSQAEWNPQDLRETTLQVLYDPGWLFKWVGSLMICAGIALLFYWKPKTQ